MVICYPTTNGRFRSEARPGICSSHFKWTIREQMPLRRCVKNSKRNSNDIFRFSRSSCWAGHLARDSHCTGADVSLQRLCQAGARLRRYREHWLGRRRFVFRTERLPNCPIPCDHIPRRSWPLFRAKAILEELIAEMPPRSWSDRQTA